MRPLGQTFHPIAWCPYKKKLGHTGRDTRDASAQMKDRENRASRRPSASQGENPEKSHCQRLDLGFLASIPVRKSISVM